MKFNKETAHELLTAHDFTQGSTKNTSNWYSKKNQEVRIMGNGFQHLKGFKTTVYLIGSLGDLKELIFNNDLNFPFIRREHSARAVFINAPKRKSRNYKK